MLRSFPSLVGRVAIIAGLGAATLAMAASQEWKDAQGNSFKAEPVEVLGSLGLFRVGHRDGRMLPWRQLSPADCVRFYEHVRDLPARAEDWAQSKSVITREIAGRVQRIQGDKLVAAELKGRPEPEFLMVFFASNGAGKSWDMLGASNWRFSQLQQARPGLVEGLFFGIGHTVTEHAAMALTMKLPWLVADFHEERRMAALLEFGSGEPGWFAVVVLNRDGVPVFSAENPTEADIKKIFADLGGLLDLMRPEFPRSWADRAYYLRAVQPVAHAGDRAEPVLVGNPLVPEGLKKNNVFRVDADLDVDADGKVTAVALPPNPDLPPSMAAPLSDALKKACLFVPAVDHGKFVAATYHYHLEVPH